VWYLYVIVVNVAVGRMQDMVEQIAKLTKAQQLYRDAFSLKEQEFNVRTLWCIII